MSLYLLHVQKNHCKFANSRKQCDTEQVKKVRTKKLNKHGTKRTDKKPD